MTSEPDSVVWQRREEDTEEDTEDIVVEKIEQPTVFKFTESDDSKLFRKFLVNWEAAWQKQSGQKVKGGNGGEGRGKEIIACNVTQCTQVEERGIENKI